MPGAGMPGYAAGTGYRERVGPQQRPRPRPRPRPEGGQYQGPQLSGPVIRQRDNALPEGTGSTGSQPIAAIAPDGLDAFARDLRALRAKAELDYEEMAERSHYTMKTLAAAAGGLRLPTLPVAIAYVRACDGDTGEWEDRWHKLAEKITAEAVKKQADGETPPEPASASDTATTQSPPSPPSAAPPPAAGQSEIFVITSAKPRQPGW